MLCNITPPQPPFTFLFLTSGILSELLKILKITGWYITGWSILQLHHTAVYKLHDVRVIYLLKYSPSLNLSVIHLKKLVKNYH